MYHLHHLMFQGRETSVEHTENGWEESKGKGDENICSKNNQE